MDKARESLNALHLKFQPADLTPKEPATVAASYRTQAEASKELGSEYIEGARLITLVAGGWNLTEDVIRRTAARMGGPEAYFNWLITPAVRKRIGSPDNLLDACRAVLEKREQEFTEDALPSAGRNVGKYIRPNWPETETPATQVAKVSGMTTLIRPKGAGDATKASPVKVSANPAVVEENKRLITGFQEENAGRATLEKLTTFRGYRARAYADGRDDLIRQLEWTEDTTDFGGWMRDMPTQPGLVTVRCEWGGEKDGKPVPPVFEGIDILGEQAKLNFIESFRNLPGEAPPIDVKPEKT